MKQSEELNSKNSKQVGGFLSRARNRA